jgi:hypothetical protein
MIDKYLRVIGLIGKAVTRIKKKAIMPVSIKSTKHFFFFILKKNIFLGRLIMAATILFVCSVIEAFWILSFFFYFFLS